MKVPWKKQNKTSRTLVSLSLSATAIPLFPAKDVNLKNILTIIKLLTFGECRLQNNNSSDNNLTLIQLQCPCAS